MREIIQNNFLPNFPNAEHRHRHRHRVPNAKLSRFDPAGRLSHDYAYSVRLLAPIRGQRSGSTRSHARQRKAGLLAGTGTGSESEAKESRTSSGVLLILRCHHLHLFRPWCMANKRSRSLSYRPERSIVVFSCSSVHSERLLFKFKSLVLRRSKSRCRRRQFGLLI